MRLFLLLAVLFGIWHHVRAQAFSGYAGDCVNTGFTGSAWDSVVTGINCRGSTPPKQARLNLDNCLSFVDGTLVGGQGGGYMSKTNCGSCVGNSPYSYTCVCQGIQTPVISLNELIGVNTTDGNLCCNAGNNEAPAVRCS